MIWCGELLLLFGLAGPIPDAVETRVRAAIAESWRVEATQVRLDWGRVATRDSIAATTAFRLLGTGRDGRFVVVVKTAGGSETAVSVRAGVLDSVWTVRRPVSMGERLAEGDLERAERLVWGPPADRAQRPIGFEVIRNLAAGDAAVAPSVAEPPVIMPGDAVAFVWERDGFRIVRQGVAASRSRRGERVLGRDDARHDQLIGIAVAPGLARLEVR